PDRPLGRKDIERKGAIDPTAFYRLYDQGERALLPTYPFLLRPGGRAAVARGPGSNRLLLDLNAGSPQAIAWRDRVKRAVITHGSGLPTVVAMRRRVGPDPHHPHG